MYTLERQFKKPKGRNTLILGVVDKWILKILKSVPNDLYIKIYDCIVHFGILKVYAINFTITKLIKKVSLIRKVKKKTCKNFTHYNSICSLFRYVLQLYFNHLRFIWTSLLLSHININGFCKFIPYSPQEIAKLILWLFIRV